MHPSFALTTRLVLAALALGALSARASADSTPGPAAGAAAARPVTAATRAASAPAAPASVASEGEAGFLVALDGSAFEVPVLGGAVCILSFPGEKMESSAPASSEDFEIMPWGDERSPDRDRVAVRATGKAPTATSALAAKSGLIKINLTFLVVPEKNDALIFVWFKAVTAEEAFQAKLDAALAKRMAPVQGALAAVKRTVEVPSGSTVSTTEVQPLGCLPERPVPTSRRRRETGWLAGAS
jgi:hypothetical protein